MNKLKIFITYGKNKYSISLDERAAALAKY